MSFIDVMEKWDDFDFDSYFSSLTNNDIEATLNKEKRDIYDFLNLLSDAALPYLEKMAAMSRELTIQHFGKTIQLYIPLYISNFCANKCLYCGFSSANKMPRKKLSLEEIEENAKSISETGMKHILFLTGEAPNLTPMPYLKDAVSILKKYFHSISIEIFPMDTDKYVEMKSVGVDGLTVYQETYDREIYDKVHIAGKKKDYNYRINAPERGAVAGFRSVNIGPLFGLAEPVKEAFYSGLHAHYLQNKYLETEVSVSLPRINPAEGVYGDFYKLSDKKFVQFILAYRLFMPRVGITVSTRENAEFRDNIMSLGVTKLSAGSLTSVGGYDHDAESGEQFEISDNRDVKTIADSIARHGYEPVYKDWEFI